MLFLLGVNAALFIIGMFIETSASIITYIPGISLFLRDLVYAK